MKIHLFKVKLHTLQVLRLITPPTPLLDSPQPDKPASWPSPALHFPNKLQNIPALPFSPKLIQTKLHILSPTVKLQENLFDTTTKEGKQDEDERNMVKLFRTHHFCAVQAFCIYCYGRENGWKYSGHVFLHFPLFFRYSRGIDFFPSLRSDHVSFMRG